MDMVKFSFPTKTKKPPVKFGMVKEDRTRFGFVVIFRLDYYIVCRSSSLRYD